MDGTQMGIYYKRIRGIRLKTVRNDIKSSGKIAIFSYLKIERGRGSKAHYGKIAIKNPNY